MRPSLVAEQAALKVTCPMCGAAPGVSCRPPALQSRADHWVCVARVNLGLQLHPVKP